MSQFEINHLTHEPTDNRQTNVEHHSSTHNLNKKPMVTNYDQLLAAHAFLY